MHGVDAAVADRVTDTSFESFSREVLSLSPPCLFLLVLLSASSRKTKNSEIAMAVQLTRVWMEGMYI